MFDVEGFILVGGKSSRMGKDKSQMLLGGETTVNRLARELAPIVNNIRLVGSQSPLGGPFENVPDVHKQWGALGGIHAALAACHAEWAAVVACDLPFVTRELFLHLLRSAGDNTATGFDAVVPIQPDERPQPLCAVYRKQTCLVTAEAMIASGEHTPRSLLAAVRTRWIQFAEIASLAGAARFFFNVNTPADYAQAKEMLQDLSN